MNKKMKPIERIFRASAKEQEELEDAKRWKNGKHNAGEPCPNHQCTGFLDVDPGATTAMCPFCIRFFRRINGQWYLHLF